MVNVPFYYKAVDWERLVQEYQPAPQYFSDMWLWPREKIEALQLERLQAAVRRAWEIPFHRRRWSEAGVSPDSIRSLADLSKIPAYTIDDIRISIERQPPLGDYQPGGLEMVAEQPMRIYWSGGTTGEPRPTLYTAWDREVGAILSARTFWLHGIRPGDVVMNAWSYSTHNAAWIMDHALWHWLGCLPITASTGNVTPTEKQIYFAQKYGATSILATSDYLLHIADAARKLGIDPVHDLKIKTLSAFGDTEPVKKAWGCPVYDSYAFHEVQYVAAECPAGGGLHIFEDAFMVEIVDFETGQPVPEGEQGNVVLTSLYKTGTQQIRYNIQDISRLHPPGRCECGSHMRKMDYFQGRSDTMVKLRGINVWPEALGRLLKGDGRSNGEYFCYVERLTRGGSFRDEMTMMVELRPGVDQALFQAELEAQINQRFGVKIAVKPVDLQALAPLTGLGQRAKLRRFEDRRK